MNVKAYIATLILALTPFGVWAQGFARLGSAADEFALPDPATRFSYPSDHGSHPEFRIEWWYLTANLTGDDGETYGIQWTLFRNALRPGGQPEDQVWMAHAAISAPGGHLSAERFARGGVGTAGVLASPFDAYIDEWSLSGPSLSDVSLTAQGDTWAYQLAFEADGPFVPQGAGGYSVKTETGLASHYYSQPFYRVRGTLTLPEGEVAVTGQGWLDREWSSQPLAGDQSGWDWLSLHLDDGTKIMGFQLRSTDRPPFATGTWIGTDGNPRPLDAGALEMSPLRQAEVAGRRIPVAWRVRIPERDFDVTIEAVYDQSWMPTVVSYWEGPITVEGSHSGVGYLEMTGYE